jgi:hypothetical protein
MLARGPGIGGGKARRRPVEDVGRRVERVDGALLRAPMPWTPGWSAGRGGDPPSIMDPLGEGAPALPAGFRGEQGTGHGVEGEKGRQGRSA